MSKGIFSFFDPVRNRYTALNSVIKMVIEIAIPVIMALSTLLPWSIFPVDLFSASFTGIEVPAGILVLISGIASIVLMFIPQFTKFRFIAYAGAFIFSLFFLFNNGAQQISAGFGLVLSLIISLLGGLWFFLIDFYPSIADTDSDSGTTERKPERKVQRPKSQRNPQKGTQRKPAKPTEKPEDEDQSPKQPDAP